MFMAMFYCHLVCVFCGHLVFSPVLVCLTMNNLITLVQKCPPVAGYAGLYSCALGKTTFACQTTFFNGRNHALKHAHYVTEVWTRLSVIQLFGRTKVSLEQKREPRAGFEMLVFNSNAFARIATETKDQPVNRRSCQVNPTFSWKRLRKQCYKTVRTVPRGVRSLEFNFTVPWNVKITVLNN
jgi:hypothetical protein